MPIPTMLRSAILGNCPNCMFGRLFQGHLKPRSSCDVCGMSFEGDGSAWMVTAFLMYLVACTLLIGEGIVLGLLFGIFPGFIAVIGASAFFVVVLSYRAARGICVWCLWKCGFL